MAMNRPFKVDRSREYWTPDRTTWAGDTAFILGGGDSLRIFDCRRIKGRGWIVAVNSSFTSAPFCDVLFFNDFSWFTDKWGEGAPDKGTPRRKTIERSQATIVTTSRQSKGMSPDRLKLVRMSANARLDALRQGRSSGHSAVSIAATYGAKRIVLLGFDMRRVNGRSHHHNEYGIADDRLYVKDFIPAFRGWDADAKKIGVEILNATPGSALREFKMIDIEELIR